jgi:hypothetical protein
MGKTLRLIMKVIIIIIIIMIITTGNTGCMFDEFQSFVTLTYTGMN